MNINYNYKRLKSDNIICLGNEDNLPAYQDKSFLYQKDWFWDISI